MAKYASRTNNTILVIWTFAVYVEKNLKIIKKEAGTDAVPAIRKSEDFEQKQLQLNI